MLEYYRILSLKYGTIVMEREQTGWTKKTKITLFRNPELVQEKVNVAGVFQDGLDPGKWKKQQHTLK